MEKAMKQIKVTMDAADDLIVSVLTEDVVRLKSDHKKVENTKKGFVYHLDYKKDIKSIKKQIKAHKRVLEYYGVK